MKITFDVSYQIERNQLLLIDSVMLFEAGLWLNVDIDCSKQE